MSTALLPQKNSTADIEQLLQTGDWTATRAALDEAIRSEPDRADWHQLLGHCQLNLNDPAAAAVAYARSVTLSPRDPAAHACFALSLQLSGNPEPAAEAARYTLELAPNDLIALKVLARIATDLSRFAEAKDWCARIVAAQPEDAEAREILRQLHAAEAAQKQEKGGLTGLLGDFGTRTKTWETLGPEHVLQQFVVGLEPKQVVIQPHSVALPPGPDGLPVPPPELSMGYAGGEPVRYLELGRNSYRSLQGILANHAVTLSAGDAILDWGCAAGRVVRNFAPEAARGCEVWGADVHAPSINWAKTHLTPFKFFNCSSLPHLPFADGKFKFIYALSVLTHIVALRDLWLLEISRVLAPGGCAILTVHNEHTWARFQKQNMPGWMPQELRGVPDMPGECIDIQGSDWEHTYTFFHSDYIRRTWGQYFTVAEIVPGAESYQTGVVLRK
jgi:SAM-dependent methyltransferase